MNRFFNYNLLAKLRCAIFITLFLIVCSTSASARDVNLLWDPSPSPDLNHYVVHWGTSSRNYTSDSGDIGLVTSYTCTLPDDGLVYYFAVTAVDDAGLSSDYSNEVNTGATGTVSSNTAPVANAGPDQNVNEGSFVYLDGSNSSDPDGDSLSYKWVQTSGTAVTLDDPTAVQPTFDAPYISSQSESLVFQLTVTDPGGLQSTDSCIVNVISVNNPPVADAGPDQNVNEGSLVYLDGSNSSDPDGDSLSYKWVQTSGTAVTLDDPTAVRPSFNSPYINSQGESLVFQLTVTDPGGLQSTDSCIVNVISVDSPPVADAGPDQNVNEGSMVYLNGSGSSDPDGDTLSYQWAQTGGTSVTLSDPTSKEPSFQAFYVDPAGETLTFQLTVTDPGGLKSTDTCLVNILWVNSPPVANAGADQTVNEGSTVYLDGSGSTDPDGDTLSFQWSQTGGTPMTLSDPTAAQTTFVVPNNFTGDSPLTFQLTVTDSGGLKATDQCSVVVTTSAHYDMTGYWNSLNGIERNKKSWITGDFVVSNNGDQVNQSFNVSFYLSDDSSFDASDTPVYTQTVSTLGVNELDDITLSNVKVNGPVIGKYLICVIDANNQIAEDNESNNIFASVIQ